MNAQDARSLLQDVERLLLASMDTVHSKRFNVRYKEDGSPVTAADTYVESLVRDYLSERLPSHILIAEESYGGGAHSPASSDFVVFLDPIDGTENFCSGLKEWGISLSIWKGRSHLSSMLLLPELGHRLISGDAINVGNSRITGLSSSFSEEFLPLLKSGAEVRITGCATFNLFSVITGRFSRFVNPKGAYVWDLIAGLMLATEHGCHVEVNGEVFDGRILEPDRRYRVDIRHGHNIRHREGS